MKLWTKHLHHLRLSSTVNVAIGFTAKSNEIWLEADEKTGDPNRPLCSIEFTNPSKLH